jgi:hypothetical protein
MSTLHVLFSKSFACLGATYDRVGLVFRHQGMKRGIFDTKVTHVMVFFPCHSFLPFKLIECRFGVDDGRDPVFRSSLRTEPS